MGCEDCLTTDEVYLSDGPKILPLVQDYETECSEMGYWTDGEWIIFDAPAEDTPTFILTTDAGSPSTTEDEGGSGHKSVGVSLISFVLTGCVLLFHAV